MRYISDTSTYHTLTDTEPTTPEIPRCSRLLSLATVSALSPWDLAVTISRLEVKQG